MKFSIITPSYNHEKYLEETIKSVISQTGNFEIEYIIMDGGSTDKSLNILRKYDRLLKNNKKIKFIWKSERDQGQSDAINKGLKISSGDIIAYINSDDFYSPNSFKHIISLFNKNKDVGFVYGRCRIVNEKGKEIRKIIKWYRTLIGRRYSYKKLLTENFIPQPTTFWRRRVYEEFGGFDVKHHLCMDYEYWCKIGQRYMGKFINQYLANFRWYMSSKSGAMYKKQFKQELETAKKYAKGRHKLNILIHKFNYFKIILIYDLMGLLKI